MFVGMARFDFLIRDSTSLKDKRQIVRRILATMRTRFNVASAEVDHEDLRQRATIGVSCVSNSSFHVKKVLQEVERFVRSQYAVEVVGASIDVVTPELEQPLSRFKREGHH